jgi:hypothetical protein
MYDSEARPGGKVMYDRAVAALREAIGVVGTTRLIAMGAAMTEGQAIDK